MTMRCVFFECCYLQRKHGWLIVALKHSLQIAQSRNVRGKTLRGRWMHTDLQNDTSEQHAETFDITICVTCD